MKVRCEVIRFFLLSIVFLLGAASSAPGNDGKQERILHFPGNTSLGLLYVLPRHQPVWPYQYLPLQEAPFVKVGPAQGTVKVPSNADLYLLVSYQAAHNPSLLTDCGADFFAGLKLYNVYSDDKTASKLSQLTGLKVLDLRGSEVTDAGLKSLGTLKNLLLLNLRDTEVTGQGLANLAAFKSLESLVLDNADIGDAGLKFVQQCPHLRLLALNHCGITDKGMHWLSSLSDIETLQVHANEGITMRGVMQLSTLKHLKQLGLESTSITANDLPQMTAFRQKVPSLQVIALRGPSFTRTRAAAWRQALPKVTIAATEFYSGTRDIPQGDVTKVFAPLHSWSER